MYSLWKLWKCIFNIRFTSWFIINLLAHFFLFSCINRLPRKLLLVFSFPELARPRCLALFITKQEKRPMLREYFKEKIMLRSYMMICPAFNSSLNSECWLKSRSSNLLHTYNIQCDWYNLVDTLSGAGFSPNSLSVDASPLMSTAAQIHMWIRCANVPPPRPPLLLPSSIYCTMECIQWNAHNGIRIHMMESAQWNLHDVRWNLYDGIRTLEFARWNPSNGMQRWNPHNGMQRWNPHNGICTMESVQWNLHNWIRTMDFTLRNPYDGMHRWNPHDRIRTIKSAW